MARLKDNIDSVTLQMFNKYPSRAIAHVGFAEVFTMKREHEGDWRSASLRQPIAVDPNSLEAVEFTLTLDEQIPVEDLLVRATNLGADLQFGHAKHLVANQNALPEEWREYDLLFPASQFGFAGHGCKDGVPALRWSAKSGWGTVLLPCSQPQETTRFGGNQRLLRRRVR